MAGTSDIEVANTAITLMGQGASLTSLADDDDAARAINAVWDLQRRAVLRAHYWNFAIARVELAADPTPPPFDWESRYRLPGDYLNLRAFYPREVAWSKEGSYLLCDYGAPIQIIYIRDVENLGAWDSLAIDAFAAKLAHTCAYRVTGDRSLREELWRTYKDYLREARHQDAMEGESTRELDVDVFQRARDYGTPY